MPDNGPFSLSVLKAGDRGGYRYDAYGKDGFFDQAVQEGTFPCLKLPKDRYINKLILLEKILAGFDLAVQRYDSKSITNLLNPVSSTDFLSTFFPPCESSGVVSLYVKIEYRRQKPE